MSDTELTPRAADFATEREFGQWQRTTRVNTRRDKKVLYNAVPMLVVGVGGLVMSIGWGFRAASIPMILLLGLVAVIGVGLSIAAVRLVRRGHLLLHRFDRGLIVERERGGSVSATLPSITARIIDYSEPGDSSSSPVPHVALHLTFADGDTMAIDEPHYAAPDALIEVGERCGRWSREQLSYLDAARLLRGGIKI